MMRKLIMGLITTLLIFGCSENPREQAAQLAEEAAALCEDGRLNEARILIDSLRRNYPDIVEARKAALRLHQDVELRVAQQELAHTDSLLILANLELENMQEEAEKHKAALQATSEELTALTKMRIRRDSIRTQFETLGAKIRYIRQKQKESEK